MGIPFGQIDDAVLLTQNKLVKRGAFVDMQTDLTDHVAVREIWEKRKKKFNGGKAWEVEYQMDHNHSAKSVGLYETDGSSMGDTMAKGEVEPRHVNAHYIYDLREKAFQRGGTSIVDFIKTKYSGMMVSFYEYLEQLLWGKPDDDDDERTPYGLAYWIVRGATEGFTGGNPAGFPNGRAGIDSNKWPRYKNYSAPYAELSDEDFVDKAVRAHRKSKFRSPLSHATPKLSDMKNGIYTNDTVISTLERLLKKSNMNLGNDIAAKEGKLLFKGTPVQYAPYLDEDAQDPWFMIDWAWMVLGTMPGWENNLSKPYMVPNKHNVRRVDLDASMNLFCSDPRRQTVLWKNA